MDFISRSITRYLLRGDTVAANASVCRLCWTKTESGSSLDRPLFIASEVFRGTLTVKEILVKLFQQGSYNEKSLPQTICDSCLETVLRFYQFWLLCQHTEHQLIAQTEWITKQVMSLQKKVGENPNRRNQNSAAMFLKSKLIDIFHTEENNKLENVLARLNVKREETNEHTELKSNNFEEASENPETLYALSCVKVKMEVGTENLQPESNDLKCSVCQNSCIKVGTMCKLCKVKLQSPKHAKVSSHIESKFRGSKFKEYFCDYCQRKFGLKSNLKFHIRTIHLNPKSYECPDCHKKMNTKIQLDAHSIVHTKVRNFQCELCGKYFVSKYALNYHIRLHTGEKPHKCDVCGEGFINASRKAAHIRRRHLGRTETCNVCSKTYHSGYPFKRHMQRHLNPKSTLYQTAVEN